VNLTADLVFSIANGFALPGWAILIWAIYRRLPWLRDVVAGRAWPLALSLIYSALILFFFAKSDGGYDTLENVKKLFATDWLLVAGWIHYLAFDLFVGAYSAKRFDEAGVARRWNILTLPAIFMFGPLGFVLAEIILFFSTRTQEVAS
jgi:membrane-bound acyltransferase YfiQ involved in biofilm formation